MVGIYGVIAYSVGQRTHEFGIRMALGAQRHRLLLLVMRQSVWTLAVGLTVGVGGAIAVTRSDGKLAIWNWPGRPADTIVDGTILMMVALIASYIPARRAAEVDPMAALRDE